MKKLLFCALLICGALGCLVFAAEPAKLGGKWQIEMTTPHGPMTGTLDLKQDGAKLSGSLNTDHMGTMPLTGTVDGQSLTMTLEAQGTQFTMSGKLEGGKLSGTIDPSVGSWSATRATALMGSVVKIDPELLEYTVKADSGAQQRFRAGPETQVVQVAPGETDLAKGKGARLPDIARGDRVLVSFVSGMDEARRIVVMSPDDIEKRNEAERLDWQKRGVTGSVASKTAEEVVIEARTAQGPVRTTVVIGSKTKLRQYAPDSVSFAAALPATIEAIAIGDQFRARGNRSGERMVAEEAVFGTFLTKVGKIVTVDAAARRVQIEEVVTKAPLVVKVTPATAVKKMGAPSGHAPEPANSGDIAQLLQNMPAGKVEEFKAGSAVIVTATRGSLPGEVTAIMLLGNVDMLLAMAQSQATSQGISLTQAMAGMHGGVMSGPSGLSLPAILP